MKIRIPLVILTILAVSILSAGCSSGKKYYNSKSKEYKKLKKKYEKYDCRCCLDPHTFPYDLSPSCLYTDR